MEEPCTLGAPLKCTEHYTLLWVLSGWIPFFSQQYSAGSGSNITNKDRTVASVDDYQVAEGTD
jgi:hypothetical protein